MNKRAKKICMALLSVISVVAATLDTATLQLVFPFGQKQVEVELKLHPQKGLPHKKQHQKLESQPIKPR